MYGIKLITECTSGPAVSTDKQDSFVIARNCTFKTKATAGIQCTGKNGYIYAENCTAEDVGYGYTSGNAAVTAVIKGGSVKEFKKQ